MSNRISWRQRIFLATSPVVVLLAVAGGCKKESGSGTSGGTTSGGTGTSGTVTADLSTPKGAARTFSRALVSGDVATAKSATTGDVNPKTFDTLSKVASSTVSLQKALIAKFGDKAKELDLFKQSPDPEEEANKAKETITGDTATLSSGPDDTDPTTLKKVDGKWKMDLTKFKALEPMLPGMDKMGDAFKQLAGDVTAGKFATLADFQTAYTAKIQAAMSSGLTPPTMPTAPK